MLKDLLKEGGLYTVANFLTKGISLLLIPFYTTYFSPDDYGIYDMLIVFGVFVGNLFSLQLNQGLARYVAEPTSTEKDKIEYASTSFIAFLVLFIVFLIVSILFSDLIISKLSPNSLLQKHTFYYALGVIFLNNIFYFLNVYLRFIRKVVLVSMFSFLHAIFGVLLMIYLVFRKDMGIDSFFVPYLIIVPLLILLQLYNLKDRLKFRFNIVKFKELTKYSIPLIGGAIAVVVMNLTDRYFINDMLGENELGVYGIGVKFSSVIGIVVAGFGTALGPIVFQNHDKSNTQKELGEMFKLFIAVGAGGALVFSLYSKELVYTFTNYNYYRATEVLPVMFFTALFAGLLMFSPGLQVKKKTKVITFLTIIFALLNFLLNNYFIPIYEMRGAAYSTLVSVVLYYSIYFYLSNKVYPFNYSVIKSSIPFIFSFIVLALLSNINSDVIFYYKPLIVVVYVLTVYKLGLLNRILKYDKTSTRT